MVAILTIKIGKRKDFALCYPPLKCCLFLRSIVHFNPLGGDTRVNQRGLLRPCILNAEGCVNVCSAVRHFDSSEE